MRSSSFRQVRDAAGRNEPEGALASLRRVRRSRRRREADPFDAFYRVYVTGLLGLFGFYLALGLVDEAEVGPSGVAWVADNGPLWVSLVAAVAIAAGIRSGANGGPLAIDDLELHHVLLSPLPRSAVLAEPARRLLLAAAGLGVLAGAAAGELASRQLPGSQAEWVLAGAAAGTSITASAVGAAFVAAASGQRRGVLSVAAVGLPVWAVVDLVTGTPTAPTSGFGRLAVVPLDASPIAIVAPVLALTLTVLGWRRRRGLSIERAHHRSSLVRQIRFAMAQQDIRSLLLLRRQLGFETPRNQPWVRVRGGGRVETRFPAVVRDARSYARWPASRLLRVGGLAVVAGFALAGVWHGTTALIAAAGAVLYVAAIEVIEPLSQELDHPGILELVPVPVGGVLLAHVASAIVVMAGLWILAGGVAALVTLDWHVAAVAAVAAIPAAAAAVAAAGLSIKRFDSPALVPTPEVEGPRLLLRLLWPPALTLAGALPVLTARNARADGAAMMPTAVNTAAVVAVVAVAAVAWLRYRDEITESMAAAQGELR